MVLKNMSILRPTGQLIDSHSQLVIGCLSWGIAVLQELPDWPGGDTDRAGQMLQLQRRVW